MKRCSPPNPYPSEKLVIGLAQLVVVACAVALIVMALWDAS